MENCITKLIKEKEHLKFLEAHSGLSAKIVEKSSFDGIWISSLTDSASRGLPDIELVSSDTRLERIREIREVSTKPIIVDWDTGGDIRHLPYWIKKLEEAGVSAVVLEDKAFPKINSLIKGEQVLEEIDKFCDKIQEAKRVAKSMWIIARLESLIAQKSVFEALVRAEAYLKAKVDAILIHSKENVTAHEVMEFAAKFKSANNKPLVAIPTTYKLPNNHLFDIVIYANHLLRASLRAMEETAKSIDEDKIAKVEDIFKHIGYDRRCSR